MDDMRTLVLPVGIVVSMTAELRIRSWWQRESDFISTSSVVRIEPYGGTSGGQVSCRATHLRESLKSPRLACKFAQSISSVRHDANQRHVVHISVAISLS
jgi:hypothetical protein